MTQQKVTAVTDFAQGVASNPFARDQSTALFAGMDTWLTASAECQREMMDFVAMRLEKDGLAAQEVITCKNMTDAMTIQARWAGETIRDYNDEMAKMMAICTKHGSSETQTKQKR